MSTVAKRRHVAQKNLANTGSDHVLPDGTKLLPEPMLIYHHDVLCYSPEGAI